MTESQIQSEILLQLGADPRWRLFRQNTGQFKVGNRFVRANFQGWPDVLCVGRGGWLAFIEVKTGTGKQTPEQKQFQKWCLSFGVIYILARNVDDARSGLTETAARFECLTQDI